MIKYLFDSFGEWIAFCKGKYVFNQDCKWIGWIPWNSDDIVTIDGDYLGTIVNSSRLYRLGDKHLKRYSGYIGCPVYPGYPGDPGYIEHSVLPPMAADINIDELDEYLSLTTLKMEVYL